MSKNFKKALSMLLAVVMIIGMAPVIAVAEDTQLSPEALSYLNSAQSDPFGIEFSAKIDNTSYGNVATFFAEYMNATTATVTLNSDLVLAGDGIYIPVMDGQNITLNFNGHYIRKSVTVSDTAYNFTGAAIKVQSGGILTTTGNGGIVSLDHCVEVESGATLTVNGGEYTTSQQTSGSAVFNNNGTLIFNKGSIVAGYYAIYNSGNATLNGGSVINTVSSSSGDWAYAISSESGTLYIPKSSTLSVSGVHGGLAIVGGTAVINGGEFSATDYYGLYVANTSDVARVIVAGGEFSGGSNGGNRAVLNSKEDPASDASSLKISGGKFHSDPRAYLADGFVATEDYGVWTVTKDGFLGANDKFRVAGQIDLFGADLTVKDDFAATLKVTGGAVGLYDAGDKGITVAMQNVPSLGVEIGSSRTNTISVGNVTADVLGANYAADPTTAYNALRGLIDGVFAKLGTIEIQGDGKTATYTVSRATDSADKTLTVTLAPSGDFSDVWAYLTGALASTTSTESAYALKVAAGSSFQIGDEMRTIMTNITAPMMDQNGEFDMETFRSSFYGNIGEITKVNTNTDKIILLLKAGTALEFGESAATLTKDVRIVVDAHTKLASGMVTRLAQNTSDTTMALIGDWTNLLSNYITISLDVEPVQYTVSFESAGGTDVASQSVYAGELALKPDAPTKTSDENNSYNFAGWYRGEDEFDFATPITDNITLTAKWSENDIANEAFYTDGNDNQIGDTLANAVTKVKDGGKVTLNPYYNVLDKDTLTVSNSIQPTKSVTIDLNGVSVTGTATRLFFVNTNGIEVKIINSGSAVTLKNTNSSKSSTVLEQSKGSLLIGASEENPNLGGGIEVLSDNGYALKIGGANGVTIYGGTFKNVLSTKTNSISTGEFRGTVTQENSSGNPLTISGGHFSNVTFVTKSTGPIEITGGLFENPTFAETTVPFFGTNQTYAYFTISGGLFSSEPDKTYIAEGYDVVNNTDEATREDYPYKVAIAKAQVGVNKYETLDDALEAITGDSGTITLLSNVDLSVDPLTEDGYAVIAAAGKTITLDLGTYTISNGALDVYGTLNVTGTTGSITGGAKHGIWVNEGAILNVQGGTITNTGAGYPVIANPGTVNISGGTIVAGANASGAVYVNNGALEMTAGTVTSNKDDTDAICIGGTTIAAITGGTVTGHDWGVTAFDTASLTVSGTAFINTANDEGYAICTNGNAGQNATVNINGGTITGKELGVYQPSGVLSISGGTITGATGVYFKSNSLSITGGTINGNGDHADYNYNGNGANPTGDALVIDSCGYPNGINDVSVSGGNFSSTGTNTQAVACYTYQQNTPVTNFITGGKYSSEPDSSYVASGYKAASISGETYKFQVGVATITATTNGALSDTMVSYNVSTIVKESSDVNAVELEKNTSLTVNVTANTEEPADAGAAGKAAAPLSNIKDNETLQTIVSDAIEAAGASITESTTAANVVIQVVKSAADTTTEPGKATYDVHPEAVISVGGNEVGRVELTNSQIKNSFSFKLYALNIAGVGSKIKVTHIHDDGTSEELGPFTVASDGYITVTGITEFSQFTLEEVTISTTDLASYGYTLALEDSIDIIFNVKNLKDDPSNYSVTYTFKGEEKTVPQLTSTTLNSITVASCAAKEMGEVVHIVVKHNGTTIRETDLSVKGYCEYNIANSTNTYLVNICKAVLDYGRYAQETFNYNTSNLVNGGSDYFTNANITVPTHSYTKEGTSPDGITGVSASLITTSATQLVVYFAYTGEPTGYTVKVGDLNENTSTIDNESGVTDWTTENGKIKVVITGIAAKNLGVKKAVTISDGSNSYVLKFSPVDYMGLQVNYFRNQVNINRAFYNYYIKAVDYFAHK